MMIEPRSDNHDHTRPHPDDSASEVEILIGRFVDGEAGAPDVERFSDLVGPRDGAALRALLERKRDHALLRQVVANELSGAEQIDLPGVRLGRGQPGAMWIRQASTYVAWAAVLALAVVLIFDKRPIQAAQFIDQDRMAEHIVGERELGVRLPPMLTHTEKLPDGRYLLTIIERRARQLYLDHLDDEWITREADVPPDLDDLQQDEQTDDRGRGSSI